MKEKSIFEIKDERRKAMEKLTSDIHNLILEEECDLSDHEIFAAIHNLIAQFASYDLKFNEPISYETHFMGTFPNDHLEIKTEVVKVRRDLN